MDSYYVRVIRTDTDLDTGFGPFSTLAEANEYAEYYDEVHAEADWLDSLALTTERPLDALYPRHEVSQS